MTITINWENRIVNSDASITDILAFKDTLRDFEDNAVGMLYPIMITFKQVDVGGGAFFYAVDLINDYRLQFPSGNFVINGNISGGVIPVSGLFVERIKALAYATTSVGGNDGSFTETDRNNLLLSTDHARAANQQTKI